MSLHRQRNVGSASTAAALALGETGKGQLLIVDGLGLRFGALSALSRVSFELPLNTWMGVVGPNGSGKSSLMNCIAGQYVATQGVVTYKGLEVTRESPASHKRAGMARIFQNLSLAPSMSLRENIEVGIEGRRGSKIERRSAALEVEEEMERWGLSSYARRFPSEVPYGLRKASETVRALLSKPSLLLLDEPAAGLSSNERQRMIEKFRELKNRKEDLAVLLVEHDVGFVKALCPNLVALDAGLVIAEGTADSVLARPEVIEAFLGKGGS